MRSLFISLVGLCFLGLAVASSWDQYLEPEPSENNCKRIKLEHFVEDLGSGDENEDLRLRTVFFCKQSIERKVKYAVANMDEKLKTRIDNLVESIIEANFGLGFEGKDFRMPHENILKGILKAIDSNVAKLSSINDYDEFKSSYGRLRDDCKQYMKSLNQLSWDYYGIFHSKNADIKPEPSVSKWVRNNYVCDFITEESVTYCSQAFDLLEENNKSDIAKKTSKKGGLFKRFRARSSKY